MSASKVTFAYLLPQSYPTLSIGKTTASVTFDVSGDTSISGNLNVDSGLIFTNASTNRVGIGKTNPTVLFDVSGDTTITGNLNVDSGLIFTDASTNRVGIGKTNPTVLFDVSGNTSISGTLTVDTNTLYVDTINKRIGIRKTNPGTVLDVSGNGAIAGNLTVGSLPILNVDSSNNRIGIGIANPTRTLDISGSTRISAALDVSGATAITGNLVVNTNNLFVDAANGRVGIGMNNPSRALEVTGAARITSTLDVSGATAITGNLTVKTNVLAVDTINNRVGIGMNNPITPFQVSLSDATRNATTRVIGDIPAWDNTYAIFGRPTVTSGVTSGAVGVGYNDASGIGVITCLAPGNAWKDMNYTASAHRFHGNGAERVTITGSTGYVGIGLTNPSVALHVNGYFIGRPQMTILRDVKSSGTAAFSVSPATNTLIKRDLNNTVIDDIGVTLSSNAFTLPAGTYHIRAYAPGHNCDITRIYLLNNSNSTVVAIGLNVYSGTSSNVSVVSTLDHHLTIASSITYNISQRFGQTPFASCGGVPFGVTGESEVYTTVHITRLA